MPQGGYLPFGLEPSGDLTAYTPTFRERATDWLRQKLFTDDRAGQDKAKRLMSVAELPFGLGFDAYDAGREAGMGNYGTAAVIGAMAGIPGPSPKKYVYSMRYRPPSNATVPEGFSAFGPANMEHKFGTVEYTRPLSSQEITDYELLPLDPKHPFNLRKSFDDFQERFVDEFSNSGERYKSPNGDFIVTPNLSGDGWQVTHFATDGQPSGHDVITDFDELARFVWSSQRPSSK